MKPRSSFLGYSSITEAPEGIRSSVAPTTAWSYMVVDLGLILPLCLDIKLSFKSGNKKQQERRKKLEYVRCGVCSGKLWAAALQTLSIAAGMC